MDAQIKKAWEELREELNDTKRPARDALEAAEEIAADLEMMIDGLRGDVQRDEGT